MPEEVKDIKTPEKTEAKSGSSVNEDELMAAICSILPGEEASPAAPPTPATPQTSVTELDDSLKSPSISDVKSPVASSADKVLPKSSEVRPQGLKSPRKEDVNKTPVRDSFVDFSKTPNTKEISGKEDLAKDTHQSPCPTGSDRETAMMSEIKIPDPCHQPDDDGDEPIADLEDTESLQPETPQPETPQPETPQPETPEKKEEAKRGRKGKKSHDEDDDEPAPVRSSPRSRERLDLNNENSQERFSSRGRKIIPKERDDELTGFSGQTRKTQQQTQADSPRGRGRRGTASVEDGIKPRRGRRGSLKHTDEEGDNAEEDSHDEGEEVGVARGRGSGLRRRRGGRGRLSRTSDSHPDDREDEESKDEFEDKLETSGDTDLDVQVDSPRTRRSRRGKAGRRAETGSTSPRTRSTDSSLSPRGKLFDGGTTSPKASELSKPFVKLEKLRLPDMRADEKKEEEKEANTAMASRFSFNRFGSRIRTTSETDKTEGCKTGKDLYEWEDDDEKPPPVSLHNQRPRNKRKIGEWESPRKPAGIEDITQDSSSSVTEDKYEEKKLNDKPEEEQKFVKDEEKRVEEKVEEKKVEEKKFDDKKFEEKISKKLDVKVEEAKVEARVEEHKIEEKKVQEKKVEEKREIKKPPHDVPDINDTFIPASMSGARTMNDDFQNHPAMTPLNILVPTSVGEMPRITVPPDSRPQSGHNSPTDSHHLPPKLEMKKEKDEAAKLLIPPRGQSQQSNLDSYR